MRMWLSYEKPGEEGYILKNNKNKVDRIERTSCNNKCGRERGRIQLGRQEADPYRALVSQVKGFVKVLQRGNVILRF